LIFFQALFSSAFFPVGADAPSSTSVSFTYWIARQTVPLQTPYSAAIPVRHSRKYFKAMYSLSSAVSLRGSLPFLCNASNSFWRINSCSFGYYTISCVINKSNIKAIFTSPNTPACASPPYGGSAYATARSFRYAPFPRHTPPAFCLPWSLLLKAFIRTAKTSSNRRFATAGYLRDTPRLCAFDKELTIS
jgi:hypothetical protein